VRMALGCRLGHPLVRQPDGKRLPRTSHQMSENAPGVMVIPRPRDRSHRPTRGLIPAISSSSMPRTRRGRSTTSASTGRLGGIAWGRTGARETPVPLGTTAERRQALARVGGDRRDRGRVRP
jgi:hypothetical protein